MTISMRKVRDWCVAQKRDSPISGTRLALLALMSVPIYAIAKWGYHADGDTIAVLLAGAVAAVALNVAASVLMEPRSGNNTVPWILAFVLGVVIVITSNRVLTELRPEMTAITLRNMNRQVHVRFDLRHVEGDLYVNLVGEVGVFPQKAKSVGSGWEADVFIGEAGKRCDFLYDLEVFEVRGEARREMAEITKHLDPNVGVPGANLPKRRPVTVPIKVQKNDCAPTSAAVMR